jgi:hypothetical protein
LATVSQHPLVHVSPGQQGSFSLPQGAHVLVESQNTGESGVEPRHLSFGQQG